MDERLLNEFIEYIIDINDFNGNKSISSDMLYKFINIIVDRSYFPVDLDIIVELLDTEKGIILRTLKKSYNEGIDYVFSGKLNVTNGRPINKIQLNTFMEKPVFQIQ